MVPILVFQVETRIGTIYPRRADDPSLARGTTRQQPTAFAAWRVAYNPGNGLGFRITRVGMHNDSPRTVPRVVLRHDQRLSTYRSAPGGHRAGFVLTRGCGAADGDRVGRRVPGHASGHPHIGRLSHHPRLPSQ